jgi:hypothetical protein
MVFTLRSVFTAKVVPVKFVARPQLCAALYETIKQEVN